MLSPKTFVEHSSTLQLERDITATDAEIDELVYELYGITSARSVNRRRDTLGAVWQHQFWDRFDYVRLPEQYRV